MVFFSATPPLPDPPPGPECGPGTYSLDGRNGTGDKACRHCPANSAGREDFVMYSQGGSGYGSKYCVCNAGYTGDLSFSWDGKPKDVSCTACDEGKYKPDVTSGCYECRGNSRSVRGSASAASCLCNAGYQPCIGGVTCSIGNFIAPCEQCGAGKYKDSRANENCTSCPSKHSSPIGSTSLSSCTPIICTPGSPSADCPPSSGSQSQGVCKTLMVVGLVVGIVFIS